MANSDYRYLICTWTSEEIEDYDEAYGSFESSTSYGRKDVMDFGSIVGSTNNEDEAYRICADYGEKNYYGATFIYDNEERRWFN